jgi:single-strand DNA-binding protein
MGTSINMQVTGFVGSDPQVKQVGEQRVATFSIAVNRKNGNGNKQTLWVRVNAWNKLADVAAQYVKKGSLVQVNAEWLRQSAYVDQTGTPQPSLDIDASRLVLLDRAENGDNGHNDDGADIPF